LGTNDATSAYLCRYITSPALANDRVKISAKGQVELKLKTPWRDGTTHHVMSPLEFMQRLAVLVPRCRESSAHGRPMRLGWAKLLKRAFNLDLTHCPHCGGDLRMIAPVMQRQAPKYSGCEGGCLECELAQTDADFQRYFCASKAHLPKETRK
jgi:Putative transposase